MFTGLIEEIGVLVELTRGRGITLGVKAARVLADLSVGDSIAVGGPCLTVDRVEGDRFHVSLLPETAEATTLGAARLGQRVNLERPLRLGGRLGGHLVSGHVDGVAEVTSVQERGDTRLLGLVCPAGLEQYLVDRGSVALDGVSLTVRAPTACRFSVALVGATLGATTLGYLRVGDGVNFEADLLAKHVAKLLTAHAAPGVEHKLVEWLSEAYSQ